MSRVICPNCGTEYDLGKESCWVNGDPMPNNNQIVGELIPAKINNNVNVKENIMTENNTINNTNSNVNNDKEGVKVMDMMNGMDMNAFAQMVAQMIKNETKTQSTETVVQATEITNNNITESTIEGGIWAKTSKYYGKEICGFMYNPYLNRRWLPKQFIELMETYNRNVDEGIRKTVSYMDAIKYLIAEIDKMVKLQKKDRIAFEERKQFWTPEMCKAILLQYLNDSLEYIETLKNHAKGQYISIPGIGYFTYTKEVKPNMKKKQFEKVVKINSNIESKIKNAIEDLTNMKIYCWSGYKELSKFTKGMPLVKLPALYKEKYVYTYSDGKGSWVKKNTYNSKGYRLSKDFVEGYKKSGAYYTLKDKIEFDNACFKGLYGREAVTKLRSYLDDGNLAYQFYAMLKEII